MISTEDNALNTPATSIDPLLRRGTLSNGIQYFIRPCKKPIGSADISLIVRVGSLAEDDSQRGYAHFVEHLGFKGTANFAQYDLVRELEQLGVAYGPDVNASTHLMETKYQLSIPTSNELSSLKRGIFVLSEWAFRMRISASDVDEEKNVILAEYRAKQGLSQRLLHSYWPRVFSNASRISHRMPIGIPDIFMNVSNDNLQQFYNTWYHPSNMCIVLTGDFEDHVDAIEAHIADVFNIECDRSSIKPIATNDVKELLPNHSNDVVIALTDKEILVPQISLELCWPLNQSVHSEAHNETLLKLFISLLSYRIQKALHGVGNNPFILTKDSDDVSSSHPRIRSDNIGTSISDRELVRAFKVFGITMRLQLDNQGDREHTQQQLRSCLSALFYELKRLSLYGFDEFELARARQKWQEKYQEMRRNSDKVSSSTVAADIQRYYLSEGTTHLNSPLDRANMYLECLSALTLSDLNEMGKLVDFHINDGNSIYYSEAFRGALGPLGIQGNSFRVLSCQLKESEEMNDEMFSCLLQQCRDDVAAMEPGRWPIKEPLTPIEVISAAQCVLYADLLAKYKRDHHAKNAESAQPLFLSCACCNDSIIMKDDDQELDDTFVLCGACSLSEKPLRENVEIISLEEPQPAEPEAQLIEAIDTYHVELNNGIKVCFKYMPNESPDKIAMQAFCLHGTSELNAAGSTVVSIIDDLIRSSGVRWTFDKAHEGDVENTVRIVANDMKDLETQSQCSVSLQKHYYHRGLGGSCPKDKLELMMAFLCLKLSPAQHICENELASMKKRLAVMNEAEKSSPYTPFLERARILACGDLGTSNEDVYDQVSIDFVKSLYQKEFIDDASKFVYVFVGDLPPIQEMINVLGGYLGQLPKAKEIVSKPIKQLPMQFRQDRVRDTVTYESSSEDDKASAIMAYSLKLPEDDVSDFNQSLHIDLCIRIVQMRLIESLRMKLGKVYTVTVEKSRNSLANVVLITIGFHCSPEDVDHLYQVIEEELQNLQSNGPSENEFKSAVEIMLKNHNLSLSNPSYWLFWILDSYKAFQAAHGQLEGSEVFQFLSSAVAMRSLKRAEILSSLSPEMVTNASKICFDVSKGTLVDLKPVPRAPSPSTSPSPQSA